HAPAATRSTTSSTSAHCPMTTIRGSHERNQTGRTKRNRAGARTRTRARRRAGFTRPDGVTLALCHTRGRARAPARFVFLTFDEGFMPIPTRPLGKTGVNVSIICLGGWHIGQPAIGDAEAERIMHAAIDEGVTFFDNAWDYHDGRSEEIMGKA